MNKEVVTDPLEPEDLWNDLRANIELLDRLHVRKVELFFGYSWGSSVYEKEWHSIPVDISGIITMIEDVENKGYGKLATDNLYLSIPSYNCRIHYSYEADIHISYKDLNPFTDSVLDRWSSQKWLLVHWSKQKQAQQKRK